MNGLPHFTVDGPADAPALLLGPSLGTSLAVWNAQVPALARDFRVVRWDLPGHGGSPADLIGSGAAVTGLARLVVGIADHLGIDRFTHLGISLGGAVGASLALDHPDRIDSLVLVCSSARFGEPGGWHDRAALVRAHGTATLIQAARSRWFTNGFADPAADRLIADLSAADPAAYAACCDALAAFDLRADLHRITAPTLIVAGRDDIATPPAHARALADGIAAATLVEIPHAAHLAPVEQPRAVDAALRAFLGPLGSATTDAERRAKGMSVRRACLGDAHVDRAVARTTGFTAPFQDFITRYAWGEIWTRPGLERRSRSCVTLTALVAGGHHEELALHVRAALRNGLTPDEIGEVILHAAVYVGVPAANSAFAVAQRVLDEESDIR
ncbi:3-oxoadipate enol-lactonase/4-carboxymuconolactone decarboxylase [Allocatelliglobosispora scoriae]|uniref:3-oxoadipate enol-lactonase/4-carboxymuconolactone decarboxylase n=1 Tax=Allocatelliglobosispora scoriae TaxID=643052 RepID=A0A841BIH4_9ACTN|nr:3-oxoadipate enol-lactonase [Allocatelliglobosispora scoriae]MBB5867405.1 3-oxoadipate enol-lactonase/4-carboxymuconolactone decarboxylase [Allocatelliglobosispora scoriae]